MRLPNPDGSAVSRLLEQSLHTSTSGLAGTNRVCKSRRRVRDLNDAGRALSLLRMKSMVVIIVIVPKPEGRVFKLAS